MGYNLQNVTSHGDTAAWSYYRAVSDTHNVTMVTRHKYTSVLCKLVEINGSQYLTGWFMKPGGLILYSQGPCNNPYPEQSQLNSSY